ncbi:hypothetical protein MIR68_010670 [Amoeboaphelidium protococcarum]|nr:hypothetical protein MIR68_010670 [Amoeboaphelidium protococcarum]
MTIEMLAQTLNTQEDLRGNTSSASHVPEDPMALVNGSGDSALSMPAKSAIPSMYQSKYSAYMTDYPKTQLISHSQHGLMFGDYRLLQTLGEGEFGKVKLALTSSMEPVAIKFIKKKMLTSSNRLKKVLREIRLLESSHHKHIVQLIQVLESEKYIGVVMEYASGGELFDYILKKRHLKESEAKRLFIQLISGVRYLHQNGIVHRDLKLENLLLDSKKNIKITDLGFGNVTQAGQLLKTSCGSPCYASPELVLSSSYDGFAADVWSCGVILYAMVCCYLPFDDDVTNPDSSNVNKLYQYILNCIDGDGQQPPLGIKFPDWVGKDVRDLCRKILVVDPVHRYTIDDILKHKWLQSVASYIDDSVLVKSVSSLFSQSNSTLFDSTGALSDASIRSGTLTEQSSSSQNFEPLFDVKPRAQTDYTTSTAISQQKKKGKLLSIDTAAALAWFRRHTASNASSNKIPSSQSELLSTDTLNSTPNDRQSLQSGNALVGHQLSYQRQRKPHGRLKSPFQMFKKSPLLQPTRLNHANIGVQTADQSLPHLAEHAEEACDVAQPNAPVSSQEVSWDNDNNNDSERRRNSFKAAFMSATASLRLMSIHKNKNRPNVD